MTVAVMDHTNIPVYFSIRIGGSPWLGSNSEQRGLFFDPGRLLHWEMPPSSPQLVSKGYMSSALVCTT